MADMPITSDTNETVLKPVTTPVQKDQTIEVTDQNAAKLTVHFLSQIHARLGYIVKLLETKKKGGK